MSFDWLNVPGLNLSNESQTSVVSDTPPPAVSFNVFKSGPSNVKSESHSNPFSQCQNSLNPHPANLNDSTENNKGNSISTADSPSENDVSSTVSESSQDLQIPLGISKSHLSAVEQRTYLRWYNDLRSRVGPKDVTLMDVFQFLSNFEVSKELWDRITQIFTSCRFALNADQFCAILRVVSHGLQSNELPTRRMILEKAPVLKPKSILSSTAGQEVYEEVFDDSLNSTDRKMDFDGFASLLLTGNTIKKNIRRKIMKRHDQIKKVRFSHNLITLPKHVNKNFLHHNVSEGSSNTHKSDSNDKNNTKQEDSAMDLSLPMGQLLLKLSHRRDKNTALVTELPADPTPETQEEKEVLEDMKDSLNHFRQIQKVDNVTMLPQDLSSNSFANLNDSKQVVIEPLKPTATGSANYLFRQTVQNTQHETPSNSVFLEPLKPTATGSANQMFRNIFDNSSNVSLNNKNGSFQNSQVLSQNVSPSGDGHVQFTMPLKPSSTGSADYMVQQNSHEFRPFQSSVPLLDKSVSSSSVQPQSQSIPPKHHTYTSSSQPPLLHNPNQSSENYFQSLLNAPVSPALTTSPMNTGSSFHQPVSNINVPNSHNMYQQNLRYSSPQLHNQFSSAARPPLPPRINVTSPMPFSHPNAIRSEENTLNDLRDLQQQVDQLNLNYQYGNRGRY